MWSSRKVASLRVAQWLLGESPRTLVGIEGRMQRRSYRSFVGFHNLAAGDEASLDRHWQNDRFIGVIDTYIRLRRHIADTRYQHSPQSPAMEHH